MENCCTYISMGLISSQEEYTQIKLILQFYKFVRCNINKESYTKNWYHCQEAVHIGEFNFKLFSYFDGKD